MAPGEERSLQAPGSDKKRSESIKKVAVKGGAGAGKQGPGGLSHPKQVSPRKPTEKSKGSAGPALEEERVLLYKRQARRAASLGGAPRGACCPRAMPDLGRPGGDSWMLLGRKPGQFRWLLAPRRLWPGTLCRRPWASCVQVRVRARLEGPDAVCDWPRLGSAPPRGCLCGQGGSVAFHQLG